MRLPPHPKVDFGVEEIQITNNKNKETGNNFCRFNLKSLYTTRFLW